MNQSPPALRERSSPYSFELAGCKPIDLASWLQARGFSITLQLTPPQHHRLERPAPARERAIILVFQSGSVLVQGNPQPRQVAVDLLRSLVIEAQPAAEQADMFAGVQP